MCIVILENPICCHKDLYRSFIFHQQIFPNHIKLVYHIQALKQVRTKTASFRKKAKKCILCNILTSTATGSVHECITTVEVIQVKSNQH